MSLPIAIALNIVLCITLLAGLAWMMSHPRKLRPHVSTTDRHRLSLVEQEIRFDDEQDRRAA